MFDHFRLDRLDLAAEEKQTANDKDDEQDEDDERARHGVPFKIDIRIFYAFASGERHSIALAMPHALLDLLDRPIVLVGLMGAGKSTIGRRLARRLGLPFTDSDEEIAQAAGLSAGEVFEKFGEREFRDGERRVVARLIDEGPRVIATGGGAFLDAGTRALLDKAAITVWLDAPVEVLAERTARRDTRPLLRDGDREEILQKLDRERRPAYAEAHLRIPSNAQAHAKVVDAIITALEAHLAHS